MTRILAAAAIAALALTTSASAQSWTQNRIGDYTYYRSNDGWTGNSNSIGDYTYSRFQGPNGQTTSCTSNSIGDYTYTNCR